MGKKVNHCGECIHLKYEDFEGYGWCSLLEEADVHAAEEACVEFEEKEEEDFINE